MRIYQKLRNLTIILTLAAFGQAFGANCEANTTWGGFTIEVATDADKDGFYEIDSPEKLAWFSCYVNKVKKDTKAILTKSIDMEKKWFVPIGSGTNVPGFKGTFNGQNFEISNLSLKTDSLRSYDATKAYAQNVAFVGILDGGTVQNLVLKDVDIQAAVASGESGLAGSSSPISVGAVVGWQSSGRVENCVVSGSITTSGARNRVGGVVGNVKNATIINCVSSVNIVATGAETYVGGVVGALRNGGTVDLESCVYSGDNLYTLNGNAGAIAGNYENVGSLTAENLFYSGDYNGVGVLPENVEFETLYKEDLNTEEVACLLNGNTWNEEGNVCDGTHSEVWSIGQTSPSLNGSDGYKIKFHANGGVFTGGKLETAKLVAKGALITGEEIDNPTRDGKKFAGWSTEKNAGEPEENLGLSDKSKTIYAVWYDYYKVTFKTGSEEHFSEATFPDGITQKQEIMVVKHGVVSTNEFNVPTIYEIEDDLGNVTKFYFTGWSTVSQEALEEDDEVADHTINLTSLDVTENITLYAVWTKVITYRVTFNASLYGYNVIQFIKHVDQGQKAVRPTEVITKAGYKVVDWCTDESCSNGVYSFDQVLTKDETLFAKWELVPYTITYKHLNAITGEVIDNVSNPEGNLNSCTVETNAFNLATPEKNGYTFDGWYYDDKFGDVANRIDPSGLSDDKTIYAKWIPITYTIQYLSGIYISNTVDPDIKDHDQQDFHLKGSVDAFAISGCSQDGWSLTDLGEKDYELGALYKGNSSLKLYPHWNCPVYNVSYETNGGVNNSMNITKYTGHSKIALLPATYDGFHFGGWYKEIALKNKIENIENINNDITVYAKWNNEIVYNPGSALNGTSAAEDKQLKAKDAKITLKKSINNYVRDHYKLDGWAVEDGKEKVYALGFSYTANEDLLLYPYWKPVEYTATYVLNEGTMDADLSFKYTIESADITLSSPIREGYVFVGWLDSETGEVIKILPEGSFNDRTFTAQWTPAPYTIAYDLAGGTLPEGESNLETYTIETVATQLVAPSKENYEFDGWYTDADVKVTEIGGGMTGDLSLTARWTAVPFTVEYNLAGGALPEGESNLASYTIETVATQLVAPSKENYTFDGWYTDADVKVTEIGGGMTGDLSLTARWTAVPFTVAYDLAGGALPEGESNLESYTVETVATQLVSPSKDNYTFDGWFTDAGVEVTEIGGGMTGDLSLTARWTAVPFTVTYDLAGGALPEGESNLESYTVETVATQLVAPSKDNYTFDGWFTDAGVEVTEIGGGMTGALSLTARWTAKVYTIAYHNIEGATFETSNPTTYTVEDLPITLNNPIKDGYNFEGWFIDESFTGERITGIDTRLSEDDGDLYAKWSDPIEYEIAYVIDGEPAVLTPSKFTVVDNVTLAVPEMDGYTFDGWYLDDGMTGEKVTGFNAGTYAANQTFYGKWIRTYRITYVDADGLENNNPTSYTVLEDDFVLQPVSKPGFKFLGWFNEEDALVESIAAGTTGDINLTAKWAKFPILITQSGGVKILQNEDKTVVAEIDGNSTETVSFTEDVSVDRVTFDRTFSESVNSTIMLPFTVSVDEVEGGTFYEFADLTKEEDGMYHFHVKEPSASTLEANKPYIFIPSAKSITFNLNAPVAINTSVDNPTSSGNWHFIGTYQTRTFTSADPEFGFAYGFAGEEKNGLTLGKFHKVKENARLKPMRGYLLYDESRATTKSANAKISERLSIFDLPEDIDVEILSNSGVIIGGGTYNTRTGVFKMDRWYDLQGRKLNGKPTVQGTYYHNGKRVIVK